MRGRYVVAFILLLIGGGFLKAQYPSVPIDSIQYVPLDSLLKADSLQGSSPVTIEDSRYFHYPTYGDTVVITGIVMAKPGIISQGARFTSYLQDTLGGMWSGVNILTPDTSSNAQATGITSADSGYVIRMTGWVDEYPRTSVNGATEMWLIINPVIPIEILDVRSRPAPVELSVTEFSEGANALKTAPARVKYSTGERWEGVYVIIRNVYVASRSVQTTGRTYWSVQDEQGNVLSVSDQGRYFRTGSESLDPNWDVPPVGTFLEYIRGVISTIGTGYVIMPLYPGDVKIGSGPPVIRADFSERQTPTLPQPGENVTVKAIVTPLQVGPYSPVDSVAVYYSVNNAPYTRLPMAKERDSLYTATIPGQPLGSVVRYFFWATNALGKSTSFPDSSANPYFYHVISGEPKIKDVQFTVLRNGNSGLQGLSITLSGVVMADSTDILGVQNLDGTTTPSRVFIQDAAAPWSGIWIAGPGVSTLRRGDVVRVTGLVQETAILGSAGTTRIYVSSVAKTGTATLFPPVQLQTSGYSTMANGDTTAEQWESMLVEFNNVYITDDDPDHNDRRYREFIVDDGTGPLRVDDDGNTSYSINPADTARGKQILQKGWKIGTLRGIFSQTATEYKLEPRTNADYINIITSVNEDHSVVPKSYSLAQNFPNPFNPSTAIQYELPMMEHVVLKVYNILGQELFTLVNEVQKAGRYTVTVDASRLSSGVYFYQLRAGSFSSTRKMVLVR